MCIRDSGNVDKYIQYLKDSNELFNVAKEELEALQKADNKKRAKYNLFKANPIFDFVKTYLNEEQQREYIEMCIRDRFLIVLKIFILVKKKNL